MRTSPCDVDLLFSPSLIASRCSRAVAPDAEPLDVTGYSSPISHHPAFHNTWKQDYVLLLQVSCLTAQPRWMGVPGGSADRIEEVLKGALA